MNMREIFKKFIFGSWLILPDGQSVSLDTFQEMFGEAKTYHEFVAVDGGTKGYKEFFDHCQEQGVLE